MSTKSTKSFWTVRIIRIDGNNSGDLEEVKIPMHRISEEGLQNFVSALFVKHQNMSGEECLEHFVNGRAGSLMRRNTWDLRNCEVTDKNEVGYCCGEGPLFATILRTISQGEADALRLIINQNRKAA